MGDRDGDIIARRFYERNRADVVVEVVVVVAGGEGRTRMIGAKQECVISADCRRNDIWQRPVYNHSNALNGENMATVNLNHYYHIKEIILIDI